MTGGAVYQRVQPEMNLTIEAIQRRIAAGSIVEIQMLDEQSIADVRELLNAYLRVLQENNQADAVAHLYPLIQRPSDHFVKIAPLIH